MNFDLHLAVSDAWMAAEHREEPVFDLAVVCLGPLLPRHGRPDTMAVAGSGQLLYKALPAVTCRQVFVLEAMPMVGFLVFLAVLAGLVAVALAALVFAVLLAERFDRRSYRPENSRTPERAAVD